MTDRATVAVADAKRLLEQRRRLAGKLMMVKGQLQPVCEKYLADKDWRGFFDEASRLTEGFLREMDDWMRESCVVDWNDFRVANAGFLLNVELSKNHRPTTAHEAVWLIGRLIAHVYDLCKMANDEPQTFDEQLRVANVTRLRDELATLPNAMTYYDSLYAESARWQRWLKDEAAKQPPKPVATHGETLASGDDAGGGRGKAVGDETNQGADTPPNNGAHPYRFECKPEIVHVYGFGESVALEKTQGVERLIAIVTRRRVKVMELVRIGVPQQGRDRSSVDVDADRLSERESVNDERFESRLGNDAPPAVQEALRELIEQRDAAVARGDDQGAVVLTARLNAALERGKSAIGKAAAAVKKTLDRTYTRLRKNNHGTELAKHFKRCVNRARGEPDYVYAPGESDGKIVWSVK